MNIDQLTVGEAKELAGLFGAKKSKPQERKDLGIRIVILQRGWVVVGRMSKLGNDCTLTNAAVIRVWGTTKGIGEIALNGPTSNTKLDPTTDMDFHELTVIATLKCSEDKWSKHIQ